LDRLKFSNRPLPRYDVTRAVHKHVGGKAYVSVCLSVCVCLSLCLHDSSEWWQVSVHYDVIRLHRASYRSRIMSAT